VIPWKSHTTGKLEFRNFAIIIGIIGGLSVTIINKSFVANFLANPNGKSIVCSSWINVLPWVLLYKKTSVLVEGKVFPVSDAAY
jgi:hypothetical protein